MTYIFLRIVFWKPSCKSMLTTIQVKLELTYSNLSASNICCIMYILIIQPIQTLIIIHILRNTNVRQIIPYY